MTSCDQVTDDLALLVDGDSAAIARHSEHLSTCDACRDARHEATQLAEKLAHAGSDHVPAGDLLAKVLAAVDASAPATAPAPASDAKPEATPEPKPAAPAPRATTPKPAPVTPVRAAKADVIPFDRAKRSRMLVAAGAVAALAAGGIAIVKLRGGSHAPGEYSPGDDIGAIKQITRASSDKDGGVEINERGSWRVLRKNEKLPAGAQVRTDERTRTSFDLSDGTHLVLDHGTQLTFDPSEPRRIQLTAGRLLADVAHLEKRPASITTPTGKIDVVGTRFIVTATQTFTSVQVVRGQVVLHGANGEDNVNAGEEGSVDKGTVSVSPVPSLAHETEWAELVAPVVKQDEALAGLGALRAYKPGESRDRDWNLALAKHDVKVRIVGPIARTEITETFRNDANVELEGVYQFPLPSDAQIENLALDVEGGFMDGAFVDKERGAKIWKGVIDKAAPKAHREDPLEIIWVDGSWKDPALLDWKRGGRFELRVFPIPAKGARTIKLTYTQVVTPRGPWRQYTYPLAHSSDGSTVADQLTVDVEIRGATQGLVRASGYDMKPEQRSPEVSALTFTQSGFVPKGDLVIGYHAADGTKELRAWTYAGAGAVAPDETLATKQDVGIDPVVIAEQRKVAADTRPTAVLALRPQLPRWKETKPHDYMIVLDSSQSMTGERFTRATELATTLISQMDRRDRFSVMACDSECRKLGDLRSPSGDSLGQLTAWLAAQPPAGASDMVSAIRTARDSLIDGDRDRWVIYISDGFATTGFRRVADVERALANSPVQVSTIGIGADADDALLAAAARGGGGSFIAWLPGQRLSTTAIAALESTYGTSLRNVKLELPQGLADIAPATMPTMRGGEEILVAARMTGTVSGEVVLKGTVAGKPFEQRYPLQLTASTSAGNGFVPRLWASQAIAERERAGTGEDRAKIVALSQGYGVMSRETSLLVLESPAMFDAFGVDRRVPDAKWTGEQAIEEVAANGVLAAAGAATGAADSRTKHDAAPRPASKKAMNFSALDDGGGGGDYDAPVATSAPAPMPAPARDLGRGGMRGAGGGGFAPGWNGNPNMFRVRRTWTRIPSISAYDKVSPSIVKAVADAERALQKSPDSREKHRALVQALAYAGELDRARSIAEKWLDRDRLDPQALGYQADLMGRAGQRDNALRTLAGLVDLAADRVELHERMVQAYEQVGRLAQACSHRIALAAIAKKDAKVSAGALRCLRTLGRTDDADLIARALPDDTARADAEKIATADIVAPKAGGDLVVDAHWDRSADLDLSLVTPEGTRVSWMGGRADASVADATSTEREKLTVKSIKKGNYLVEVSRVGASTDTIRGTLEINVLGSKKSLPFELSGARSTVGRITISLQESIEAIDDEPGKLTMGTIPDAELRPVMMARSTDVRACYQSALMSKPSLRGRITLTIKVRGNYGQVQITGKASAGMEGVMQCAIQTLSTMHSSRGGQSFEVAMSFRP